MANPNLPFPFNLSEHVTPYDIPLVGPWTAKVGHIVDIVSTPCDPEPEVWVLAFWSAVPQFIWSLYKPEPVDYITERFGRPHRKKRRWRMHNAGPAHLGEGYTKGLGWAAFKGFQFKERAGWYFIVVDASLDFVINWTSTAFQWSGCKTPGAPYARGHSPADLIEPYAAGTRIFDLWHMQSQNIFHMDFGSIQTIPPYAPTLLCAMKDNPSPFPGETARFTNVEIIEENSGQVLASASRDPEGPEHQTLRAVARNWGQNILSPFVQTYKVRYTKTEGWLNPQGSTFAAYGLKERGMVHDP